MNRLLGAALCCSALCACTDDGTRDASPQPQTVTRHIRIEAAAPGTRTELAPDGYNVLWTPGDRIGVYVKSGDAFTTINAPLAFDGTAAAAGGTFSGNITLDEGAASYTLYAYYPYSEQGSTDATGINFALAARQTQAASGDSSHLGDYDFLVAGAVQSATGDFGPLTFRHAFAVVEADLTATGVLAGKRIASVTLFNTDAATVQPGGQLTGMANMTGNFSFDLTATTGNNAATYTDGSAQINYGGVTFAAQPTLGTEPVKVYVTVNPADYSRGNGRIYLVVRTADGYTATTSRAGLTISAGQMKVITQELADGTAPQGVTDLSAGGTANCYIASLSAQEYSFDATTAGNGVITEGLQQAIQRYEGRTLSATIPAGVARLVWQSSPYLIEPTSIGFEAGRIRFTLTERPTVLGGNAVIALYPAGSSEALWSWHIWITDQSAAQLDALAETYAMYPAYESVYGAGSAVMMDRNLGAVYKEDGPYARSFRAPLYQWGRKDPFPWGTVVFDAQSAPHNFLSEYTAVLTSGSLGLNAGYTGNTRYATAHPERFIATADGSSYDWYWGGGKGNTSAFRNNELWGNPTGYTVGQTTTKTLFDPCPPGWKMPHPYVFSAFTKTGDTADTSNANVTGTYVQGWNFLYDGINTTYYPGAGYRYDELGLFMFNGWGHYWSGAPAAADLAGSSAFGLSSTRIYERLAYPRGTGLPVRCMKDL